MRANLHRLLLLLSVCLWASSADATVTVSFTNPDSYADMGRYAEDRSAPMQEIEAHLKQLGERYLPSNQSLKIDVLDVDLAGHLRMSSRLGREVRILRGNADWPSIKLNYVLEADGRVLQERQEVIADMGYLQHTPKRYSNQSLAYEKQMIDDWFRQRFAAHKP